MQDDSMVEPVAHDLSHYLRPLRRHRRLIAGFLVAGLLLGLVVAFAQHRSFTAATRVLVKEDVTDEAVNSTDGRTSGDINLDTEVQNVRSSPVASLAKGLLHTSASPASLVGRVVVTVPANTTVMRIAYSATSGRAAVEGARAFANAYLTNRKNVAQAFLTSDEASLAKQISASQQQLDALDKTITHLPAGSTQKIQDLGQQAVLQSSIQTLNAQRNTDLTTVVNPGQVISGAALVSRGTAHRILVILAGLVLGLLGGLLGATLRERYAVTVRDPDDLLALGVQVLCELPPPLARDADHETAVRHGTARLRATQTVATALGAALGNEGGAVYVAGVSPAEPQHDMPELIAAELGRFGSSVTVVNPSKATAAEPSRTTPTSSATSPPATPPASSAPSEAAGQPALESRQADIAGFVGWPGEHHDSAPTAGEPVAAATDDAAARSDEPSEPLLSPVVATSLPTEIDAQPAWDDETLRTVKLVDVALRQSRFVVIAGDAAAADPQAYVLASLSGAAVLVVVPGVTLRSDVREAVEQIRVTSSELLGTVLWRPDRASDSSESETGSRLTGNARPVTALVSGMSKPGRFAAGRASDRLPGRIRRKPDDSSANGSGAGTRAVDAAR